VAPDLPRPQGHNDASGLARTIALPVDDVSSRLRGVVRDVDHLGLDLPAERIDRAAWRALLDPLAARALLMPFDAEGEIAFLLPATAEERRAGLAEPAAPRKPKLELVRSPAVELPMIGLSVDTDLALDELVRRFPDPEGCFRPGNEAFFRTVRLEAPWPGWLFSLDLNSRETASIEIARLLVETGHSWAVARARG
jgi:hypothetical protein